MPHLRGGGGFGILPLEAATGRPRAHSARPYAAAGQRWKKKEKIIMYSIDFKKKKGFI